MDDHLKKTLDYIGTLYKKQISPDSRHYVEVNIGKYAKELGFDDLHEKLKDTFAVIPINEPIPGMKVRIDGRTFVDYCLHPMGFAVPGYVFKDSGISCPKYEAHDSMILNCTDP